MHEKCPFGPLFATHRKRREISLWRLCLKLRYHQRNVQRIESGLQEPRLNPALRMLRAVGVEVGSFFSELAEKAGLGSSGCNRQIVLQAACEFSELQSASRTFGLLLAEARRQNGYTQQNLADMTAFHLRNMTKIENGLQEPRVMTALRLVVATGCNVAHFFNELARMMPVSDDAPAA